MATALNGGWCCWEAQKMKASRQGPIIVWEPNGDPQYYIGLQLTKKLESKSYRCTEIDLSKETRFW